MTLLLLSLLTIDCFYDHYLPVSVYYFEKLLVWRQVHKAAIVLNDGAIISSHSWNIFLKLIVIIDFQLFIATLFANMITLWFKFYYWESN